MEIRDERTAREWVSAWGGRPGRTYLAEAVAAMRRCEAISEFRGCPSEAGAYREARFYLESVTEV